MKLGRPLRDERGSTIVLVAVSMTALLSAVALAVDVGMLLNARAEAQRAADAAAMAGAGILIDAPLDEAGARAAAIEFGGYNTIHGEPVVVLPEDVDVDLEQGLVRVRVRRSASRGNALPTWFAQIFGVDQVDVGATAAAAVATGTTATCLKPWAVMDGFYDANGNGTYDDGLDTYQDALHDYAYGTDDGSAYRNGLDGNSFDKDVGRQLVLKQGDPQATIQPGWFFPWDIPQDGTPASGGDKYRWNITHCNPNPISVDEEYMVENGNMIGPTKQGVGDLIAMDSDASWDATSNSVSGCDDPCPRVVNVPLFEPTLAIDNGKKPIRFTNIMGLFLEGIDGNAVVGRIMYVRGVGDMGGGNLGPLIKYVKLVE